MRILLGLTIFLFSCSFSGKQTSKYKELIYWNKDVKLTWDDFKGNERKLVGNQSALASVTFNYIETFSGEVTIKVSFDKKQSIKRQRDICGELLRHEQYHFNITELFARKFRKILSQKINISEINSTKTGYDFLYVEYVKYQKLYDEDTNHSKNVVKQKEWEEKIDKELAELDKFENK